MNQIRKAQHSTSVLKERLRSFPTIFNAVKWVYRLFCDTEPTIQKEILKVLGNRSEVFFVQVGSNDGLQGDPIHDFIVARKNWRGIFIEPIDFLFRRLRQNYGNDERFIFENVAISTRRETKSFYYVSDKAKSELDLPYWHDQLGSFDKNHITKALGDEITNYIVTEDIECLPLDDVLERNKVEAIDLIHIDTEGFDYKVLSQLDFKHFKPSVILYEHHLLNDEEFGQARKLLRGYGYRLGQYGNDTLAIKRSFWSS